MKKYFRNCFSVIKESKLYIITSVVIFAIFYSMGLSLTTQEAIYISKKWNLKQSSGEPLCKFLNNVEKLKKDKSIIMKTSKRSISKGSFNEALNTWIHNMGYGLILCFSGIFLGIFPILYLVVIGFVSALADNSMWSVYGYRSILTVFPHCIFEIPAMIVTVGLGIKLGLSYIYSSSRSRIKNLGHALINIIKIIPLYMLILFIAAVIEEYVTMRLFIFSLRIF